MWNSFCVGIAFALLGMSTPAAADDAVRSARIEGVVRDPDHKPIAGATVEINRMTDARPEGGLPRTKTGPKGEYALELRYQGATPIVVREIWASATGHVRRQEMKPRPLKDGAVERVDFQLARGEVLAGEIRIPPTSTSARSEQPEKARYLLEVNGEGFRQYHVAEGGRFEIYVPAGVYAIRCLNPPGAEWSGLKSGSRDLKLEPKPVVLDEQRKGPLFDRVWSAVDSHYSYFIVKPDVDWDALRVMYRPRALLAGDLDQFVGVLRAMLAHLKDPHVWIDRSGRIEGCYQPPPYERKMFTKMFRTKMFRTCVVTQGQRCSGDKDVQDMRGDSACMLDDLETGADRRWDRPKMFRTKMFRTCVVTQHAC